MLWHAYLHSAYKYDIMRWVCYIVLRSVVIIVVYNLANSNLFSGCDSVLILFLYSILLCSFVIIDFITYLVYSRRFYQHLKGRELEAKLFMERHKYFENKYLRIHFKVATMLVAAALFCYNFIIVIHVSFQIFALIGTLYFREMLLDYWYFLEMMAEDLPAEFCQLLFRIILNLNYLYVFFVFLFKYCRRNKSLYRVNDRIRPLVRDYQNRIYTRQHYI